MDLDTIKWHKLNDSDLDVATTTWKQTTIIRLKHEECKDDIIIVYYSIAKINQFVKDYKISARHSSLFDWKGPS